MNPYQAISHRVDMLRLALSNAGFPMPDRLLAHPQAYLLLQRNTPRDRFPLGPDEPWSIAECVVSDALFVPEGVVLVYAGGDIVGRVDLGWHLLVAESR